MKQFLLVAGIILASMIPAQAQLSILFVDDSDDGFMNGQTFASSLDSLGYSYFYFDAEDSAVSPVDTMMMNYDLVIWHTSSDHNDLMFWNGLDEDNGNIKSYLESGGMMWVTGNDFMDDRYALPDTFEAGDFPYDYLGVSSFDVESNTSDGGVGMPLVYPDTTSVFQGLDTITWTFSTLWYADGVTPVDSASSVFFMGDSSYVLDSAIAAVWYDADTFQTLSFFFDIALAGDFSMIEQTTGAVLEYFTYIDTLGAGDTTGGDSTTAIWNRNASQFRAYPNPAKDQINLEFTLGTNSSVRVALMSLQGQEIAEMLPEQNLSAGTYSLPFGVSTSLPNGLYLLRLETESGSQMSMIQLKR